MINNNSGPWGNNDNNQNPWGRRPNNQTPPDVDEIIKNSKDKFKKFMPSNFGILKNLFIPLFSII